MTTLIHFTKMHGCGNDYIYVDTTRHPVDDPPAAAVAWSDRHRGIGSDGLVLIGRSPIPEAHFSMRIFNADGSEAMMCGNASRCIGKYVYERGLTRDTNIRLLTLAGIKTLQLHVSAGVVESVTVDMGVPVLEDERLYVSAHVGAGPVPARTGPVPARTGPVPSGTFVSMGNPHYVIFTDTPDQVVTAGPGLECHPAFPQRCNIEFAQVQTGDDALAVGRGDTIRVRVWERGSGITQACGTGACATAVAAAVTGRCGRRSCVVMDGGALDIEWREADNHVYMTGPAAFVFDGTIEEPTHKQPT